MDLIYANGNKEDLGVLHDYILDMAYGQDENNFECSIDASRHCCEPGFYLYVENTDYGGIIDSISVETSTNKITYSGRTWHGIINSKVLEPNYEEDYLIVSGEANEVIGELLARMALKGLFKASDEVSGINISNYKMNRYISGYDGIKKMLKSFGAKLRLVYKNNFVEVSAVPIIDYSSDSQFDSDQIDFSIKKNFHQINHVICLGKGELSQREVINVYADGLGNIVSAQQLFGVSELSYVYENSNAESTDELKQGGIDIINNSFDSDELKFSFNSNDEMYDVGDYVGAVEMITGIKVKAEITKKIVNIEKNQTIISYKVGDK